MIDAEAPTVVFNPFSPEFRDDPYPSYGTMRDAGPVIRTPFGSLMVTRYELVDRVLRSSAFRTPRGYRDANDPAGPPRFDPTGPLSLHRRHWLLFQSGDAHVRLRKLVTKVFTPRAPPPRSVPFRAGTARRPIADCCVPRPCCAQILPIDRSARPRPTLT